MYRGFVVESDAAVRGALVEGLAELAGVTTVGFADDEQSALAWLADPENGWDIAIVELHLGGGSGTRLLEALVKRQPQQRVVVWTASADTLERIRCRMLGVDQVFDRATEGAQLMDYCMAQSAAHALAGSPPGRSTPAESSASAVHGAPTATALFPLSL